MNAIKAAERNYKNGTDAIQRATDKFKNNMDETASALPEYPVVMAMNGVGSTLGPQLMAEIGDVTRFTHREALTAFAGVDPDGNLTPAEQVDLAAE